MNDAAIRQYLTQIQAETDRDNLRYTEIEIPGSNMTKAQLISQGQANVAFAADIQASLGVIHELANQAIQQIDTLPTPAHPILPVMDGGVLGHKKWLPGSLGCDVFVAEGSQVFAPSECEVRLIVGGTGLQGGAEVILFDGQWGWRYRHVQALPGLKVGQTVAAGYPVAVVRDRSLDILGPVPAWAGQMPSGWQHLDLSVNRGSDQFAPTGGGGGNVDADEWLLGHSYHGRVLDRTPGPPDAGYSMVESILMTTPQAYGLVA